MSNLFTKFNIFVWGGGDTSSSGDSKSYDMWSALSYKEINSCQSRNIRSFKNKNKNSKYNRYDIEMHIYTFHVWKGYAFLQKRKHIQKGRQIKTEIKVIITSQEI